MATFNPSRSRTRDDDYDQRDYYASRDSFAAFCEEYEQAAEMRKLCEELKACRKTFKKIKKKLDAKNAPGLFGMPGLYAGLNEIATTAILAAIKRVIKL